MNPKLCLERFLPAAHRLLVLPVVALLASCGGGTSGLPVVSTMSATSVAYSKTVSVVVSGNGLNNGITVSAEPGCGAMTAAAGATDSTQTFTCKATTLGSFQPRVRNGEGKEIATLRLDIPLPQVTITAAQASTSVTGTMVLELDPVRAPKTVDNFLAYVNQTTPFLRNTLFHRAVPGVLIQAGGYVTGLSPKAATLAPIELESNNGLKNLRGTVGMARTTELNSATTQFYVNLADNADFDYVDASSPGYAVFGTVVTGMDVADSIGSVVTTSLLVSGSSPPITLSNVPVNEIRITAISQTR